MRYCQLGSKPFGLALSLFLRKIANSSFSKTRFLRNPQNSTNAFFGAVETWKNGMAVELVSNSVEGLMSDFEFALNPLPLSQLIDSE